MTREDSTFFKPPEFVSNEEQRLFQKTVATPLNIPGNTVDQHRLPDLLLALSASPEDREGQTEIAKLSMRQLPC